METIVMDLYNDQLVVESSRLPLATRMLDNPVTTPQGNETANPTSTLPHTSTDVSSIVFLLGVMLFIL